MPDMLSRIEISVLKDLIALMIPIVRSLDQYIYFPQLALPALSIDTLALNKR